MQSFGSAISRMLREFCAVFVVIPFSGVGGGIGSCNHRFCVGLVDSQKRCFETWSNREIVLELNIIKHLNDLI